MTDYYLRSTTGNDGNSGTGSFANAKATLAGVLAACAAGDRIFISSVHTESSSVARTFSFPGTPTLPNQVICVVDTESAPANPAASAELATTGPYQMYFQGSFSLYGAVLRHGSGSSNNSLSIATSASVDALQRYEKCVFNLNGTSGTASVQVGTGGSANSARSRIQLRDVDIRLAAPGHRIEVYQDFSWRGGSLLAGAAISYLFRVGAQGRTSRVQIECVDFAQLAATTDLVSGPLSTGHIVFRNCRLPAAWSGNLVQGAPDPSLRVEMHNCDSADTNYRLWIEAFTGSIKSETGTVKSGGASDGTTPMSWRMVANGNPVWHLAALESPELVRWNDTIDAPVTVQVDVLSDGAPLTNADAWLEVQHLGTSGVPLGAFASGRAGLLATPVTHSASDATWNTAGMTAPQRQRMSVTFTPREKGFIHVKAMLGKAGATLFVDPKVV